MTAVRTKVKQQLCRHDYEVFWVETTSGLKGFRCRRCGHRKNE
ncbi:hypothetical protein [Natronomonas pharaonis]|nr:hypothetical protein [Natronomonas pharaonis]